VSLNGTITDIPYNNSAVDTGDDDRVSDKDYAQLESVFHE
jgi:hypothetical protein